MDRKIVKKTFGEIVNETFNAMFDKKPKNKKRKGKENK